MSQHYHPDAAQVDDQSIVRGWRAPTESSPADEISQAADTGPVAVGDDGDSAFEIEPESTNSMRSNLLKFQQENGRTYHSLSPGKYVLPNDERELERLDAVHYLNLLAFDNRLALCPKNDGANRVLDMGTGTGSWAMDYADAHPGAEVVGVDLSPVQPWYLPPNLRFEICDLDKEWSWRVPFDFIFCRDLAFSFANWEPVLQRVYDQLEPGGWFEIQDGSFPIRCDDGTLPEDSYLLQMCAYIIEAGLALGRDVDTLHYGKLMEKVGFVEVTNRDFKWPTNTWPASKKFKEMGACSLFALDRGLEGIVMALYTRGLGWTMEQTLEFCKKVRKELRNPRIHAYWPIRVTYGRKPFPNETCGTNH